MRSRGFGIALVMAAGVLTLPALLSALDRSAAFANAPPLVGGERRSIEGLRRRAAASLAARRYPAASADARSVLARQPLDRSALRLLSAAEEGLGNADLAERIAIDASFVSWRDPYTQLRMFLLTAANGDFDDAARRADALARTDAFRPAGFRSLNMLLPLPGGAGAVAARLATRPPWRDAYFQDVRRGLAAAPRQALPLVRSLARTAAPASRVEVDRILAFMVARGLAAEAWAYDRASVGAAAGAPIDDPDFQFVRILEPNQASSPFAWSMPAETMVRLVDHRDAQGRPALRIEARGDRSALFVSRRIVVAPGRYRLSYQATGASDQLDRLHPDLRCADGVAVKLQSARGADSAASVADIPAGCNVLQLGFTIEPGDSALPAELSIRRVSFTKS